MVTVTTRNPQSFIFFPLHHFLKLKLVYNGLKCDKRDHIKLGADALSPICETDLWGSKMANYPSF